MEVTMMRYLGSRRSRVPTMFDANRSTCTAGRDSSGTASSVARRTITAPATRAALMCGADNNYLALTYRQIDTIRRASLLPMTTEPTR